MVEELTPDQKMACPPMEVDIAPGTKPFYARRPRRFPLHWAEKIKKETQKLVKAGIIEKMPSDEILKWISPVGFVAKDAKEEKLRLVCDLRELNKATTSGYSIFPTPNEVMQSLKATSHYYIKTDFIQGYHQVEIAPESRNIFCFAQEIGIYHYL